MPRLFITPREMNFISDITKEVFHDINGQTIKYYPISEVRTDTSNIYGDSAPQKVFDAPIEIEALIGSPEVTTVTNQFGTESNYKLEVYLHYKDLVDKDIQVATGDFFTYGSVIYEITSINQLRTMFGHVENIDGYKLTGLQARKSQFELDKIYGPTDITHTDPDAVQTTFVQQQGLSSNRLGDTGDKRELQENGTLDPPLTGPKEVSPRGDNTGAGSSFYDDV